MLERLRLGREAPVVLGARAPVRGQVRREFMRQQTPWRGEWMTVEEFISTVDKGFIVNSDGVGFYSTLGEREAPDGTQALPSHVKARNIPLNQFGGYYYSHVTWFHK